MIRQVGVDIGNGHTKAVSSTRQVSFQSVVAPAQKIAYEAQARPESDLEIVIDGEPWFVGDLALRQSTFGVQEVGRQRVASPTYRRLFLAALSEALGQSCEAQVVCGLPVSWYEADAAGVAARLQGDYTVLRNRQPGGPRSTRYVVQRVRVVPEPLGALLSVALSAEGLITEPALFRQTVGVMDIGTKTTDFAVFGPGLEYRQDQGGSVESGLSLVLERIIAHASNTWGMELSMAEADKALRDQAVTVRGEKQGLGAVIQAGARDLSERALSRASQLWDGGLKIDRILLTGGGAPLLERRIGTAFRHAKAVEAPFMANAVGFYRWALRLSNGG